MSGFVRIQMLAGRSPSTPRRPRRVGRGLRDPRSLQRPLLARDGNRSRRRMAEPTRLSGARARTAFLRLLSHPSDGCRFFRRKGAPWEDLQSKASSSYRVANLQERKQTHLSERSSLGEKSVALSSVHLDVPLTSLAQPLEPLVEVDALGRAHGLPRESDLTYSDSRRRNTRANARSPAIVTGNQAMPAEAGAEGDGATGQTRSSTAAHKSVTGLRGRGGGGFVP